MLRRLLATRAPASVLFEGFQRPKLERLFLLLVGAGTWSLDKRLAR
jgi:hypothetical protein